MAVIHRAELSPSKLDLLGRWLAGQAWAPQGEPTLIGAYRYDDRDGEVGIEGHLLEVGGGTVHIVTTYRAAPLEGAEAFLIGTMDHSVLGPRWMYDAAGDPVALRELADAALTGTAQAELVIVDEHENEVERRQSAVQVTGSPAGSPATDPGTASVEILHLPAASAPAEAATLTGRWSGGEGVLVVVRA